MRISRELRLQDRLALKILAGEFHEGETIRVDRSGASLRLAPQGVEVVEGEVAA